MDLVGVLASAIGQQLAAMGASPLHGAPRLSRAAATAAAATAPDPQLLLLAHGRKRIGDCVDAMVEELSRGVFLGLVASPLTCKASAARALGEVALWGCPDTLERMAKAGAVQALLRLLRLAVPLGPLGARWTGGLFRVKAEVAFAVAGLARGSDLSRGRLLEAGAMGLLEPLWSGQVHNVDGEDAVAMREECRKALVAVRGGPKGLLEVQGLHAAADSSFATPIASRSASPIGSPGRQRHRSVSVRGGAPAVPPGPPRSSDRDSHPGPDAALAGPGPPGTRVTGGGEFA